MPTERKSPALELPREAKTTPKELDYEEPQPIGAPTEFNIGLDLVEPQGLPALYRGSEIIAKDGFYVSCSVSGSTFDSSDSGNLQRYLSTTPASYGTFFIAKRPCEVLWVSEKHVGASASFTLDVKKGTALVTAGVTTLLTTFDLSDTPDTVYTRSGTTLTATSENRRLAPGDWLFLEVSSGPSVTEVFVEVYMKYLGEGDYK